MAKNDNLTDFLTDVADAIRAKKGTTDKINPQDFADEIASIETSQEVVEAPFNDVNFRDYDGTILYSYSKDEFLALTELPPLPSQKGLICQEWNWTYEEAMAYVAEYGILEVGATYITDDGATRLYMQITDEEFLTIPLLFWQSVSNGVGIDWGDGSQIETFEGTGQKQVSHTYASRGNYIIRIVCNNGYWYPTSRTSGNSIFGPISAKGYSVIANYLRRAEFGDKVDAWGYQCLSGCNQCDTITLSNTITKFDGWGTPFVRFVMPRSVTTIGARGFSNVTYVCFPSSVTTLGSSSFYNNPRITGLVLPNLTAIPLEMLAYAGNMLKLLIPKSVQSIGARAFVNATRMLYYDFTHHEQVPTLENIDAFTNIPTDCEIRVPKALEEEWKQATNWCESADKIVGYD